MFPRVSYYSLLLRTNSWMRLCLSAGLLIAQAKPEREQICFYELPALAAMIRRLFLQCEQVGILSQLKATEFEALDKRTSLVTLV